MNGYSKRIVDKRLLGIIRRYLQAGVMAGGLVTERHEGSPQGGPLSPLLANVLLGCVAPRARRLCSGERFRCRMTSVAMLAACIFVDV